MEHIFKQRIAGDGLGMWWIGQGGYIFKSPRGVVIVVDPYLSDVAGERGEGYKRLFPTPIEPRDLRADIIAFTHDHLDHLDEETIAPIEDKSAITFLGPRNVCRHLKAMGIKEEQILLLEAGDELECKGIKFTGVFTLPTDEGSLDGEGFVIEFENALTVYVTGDTSYCEFLGYIKKFKPDIMFTCINGKAGNMNPDEAAQLTEMVQPKLAVPMHYGVFAANTRDPEEFRDALQKRGIASKCLILEPMQFFQYKRGAR